MVLFSGSWLPRIKENPINPRGKLNCRSHTLRCNFKDKSANRIEKAKRSLRHIKERVLAPNNAREIKRNGATSQPYISLNKLQDV